MVRAGLSFFRLVLKAQALRLEEPEISLKIRQNDKARVENLGFVV
jgi:hypothetical protein